MRNKIALFAVLMFCVASFTTVSYANCGSCAVQAEPEGSAKKACGTNCQKACCQKKKACGPNCQKACCQSNAYQVGSKVSDFELMNTKAGEKSKLSKLAGEKGTMLIFWNQNCPYVQDCVERVDAFQKEFSAKGINVVAIDAGTNNKEEAIQKYAKNRMFPVLANPDSKVAAKFGATRTPEVFLLDKNMTVQYHGAFDSGTYNNSGAEIKEVKTYAKDAANAVLAGNEPEVKSTKAFGCSVKYADGVKPMKSASKKSG